MRLTACSKAQHRKTDFLKDQSMNIKHPKPNNKRKILRTQQLCAAAFALAAGLSFQTAWASCTVSVPAVNEMKVDFLNNEGLEKVIEMDVNCSRPDSEKEVTETIHVCVQIDSGIPLARGRVEPRYATGTGGSLAYNIYTDPQYTQIAFTNAFLGGSIPERILHTTVPFVAESLSGSGKIYAYVKIPQQTAAAAEYTGNFSQNSSSIIISKTDCRKMRVSDTTKINNFSIKATVINSCKIEVPANINFGEKSIKDRSLLGQTSINVTCSKDHPYYIGLTSKYGNAQGRGKMKHQTGSDTIDYSLRRSSSFTGQLWGDSGNTAQTQGSVQFTGTGTRQSHPVYATISNIPPNVSAGEYQDTVTVNVYY